MWLNVISSPPPILGDQAGLKLQPFNHGDWLLWLAHPEAIYGPMVNCLISITKAFLSFRKSQDSRSSMSGSVQFSSVTQSCPTLCTPWIAAHQASLSITNSRSSLRLASIKSVMPSSHPCQVFLDKDKFFIRAQLGLKLTRSSVDWYPKWITNFLYDWGGTAHPGLQTISPPSAWCRTAVFTVTTATREYAIESSVYQPGQKADDQRSTQNPLLD